MDRRKRLVAKDIVRRLTDGNTNRRTQYRQLVDAFINAAMRGAVSDDHPLNQVSAPISIIDLFCGCGGASAGFLSVNRTLPVFKAVSAWDIDGDACSTYEQLGFKPTNGDIGTILADIEILKDLKRKKGDARPSVLIGCPPCQGFSAYRKTMPEAAEDGRNNLVDLFSLIAAELKPDYVFMENVPELLSEKYRTHFEFFNRQMKSKGYHVASGVLNMAGFGLPQARKRAIVIASLDPVRLPEQFLSRKDFVTVRRAISHLPKIAAGEQDKTDQMHVTAGHRDGTLDVIRSVPKDGGSRQSGFGPKRLDEAAGFSDVYGRLRWDKPSVTITGSARNPASGRFVHPDQDRGISIREALILQGFPESFSLNGSFGQKFTLVGNAVPPMFAAAVAAHLVFDMTGYPETA